MNVGYLLEKLENFQLSDELFHLLGERFTLLQVDRAVIVAALMMGFLWCFFGLHGIRIWSAILGFSIGYLVFSKVASLFLQDSVVVFIIAIVFGLALAVVNARFYLFGAFFYAFVTTGGLALFWLNPQNTMLLATCVMIALLGAVLVLKQPNIIVILLSAVVGSVVFITYIRQMVFLSDLFGVVSLVIMIIIGALIQFVLLSGREKRKQIARAAEIRLQQAIASEIEKARNFLDELEVEKKEEKKLTKTSKRVKEEKTEEKSANSPVIQAEDDIVKKLTDELAYSLGEKSEEVIATELEEMSGIASKQEMGEKAEEELLEASEQELEKEEKKSGLTFAQELERELAIKFSLEQELERELAARSSLEQELEKELEAKFELEKGEESEEVIEAKPTDDIETEAEAEAIEIAKEVLDDDFTGVLDLGRIQRPVDEYGFSEFDEVGEIEL